MTSKCRSQHRCALTSCASCARRYASRLSRRILAHEARNLHVVEIGIGTSHVSDFHSWRIEARNLIDYRRRTSRWWCESGLHVWLAHDSRLLGVVTLGSVTAEEFILAFTSRWPTALRPISSDNLRNEIFGAVRPGVITPAGSSRYQSLKLAIWPRRRVSPTKSSISSATSGRHVEPMPVLI
jgi:hypothetical protein